jgi:hypothetical protein
MARRLISFGSYVFPDTQGQLNDNFLNTVTRTTRLPGLSGGFDELGQGSAPSEVGNLRLSFWLIGKNRQDIQRLRDEVRGLAELGVQTLRLQPVDPAEGVRTVQARISNIEMNENAAEMYETQQRVAINFQVSYPRWERVAVGEDGVSWGSGAWGTGTWGGSGWQYVGNPYYEPPKWGANTWGGGGRWGGSAPSAITQTLSVTNLGNVTALLQLRFHARVACPGGIVIERVVGGVAVEAITLASTSASQSWDINGRSLSVQRELLDAYSLFSATSPRWLTLAAGVNNIRFTFPSGAGGNVKFLFNHTWI